MRPDLLFRCRLKPRGLILLPTLMVMVVISLLLLTWFQQEIQHRFQTQAFFRMQTVYQELNGVIAWGKERLKAYSHAELTQDTLQLGSSKFAPRFPDWTAEVHAEETTVKMRLDYHSQQETILSFETLFAATRHRLFDIPWIVLNPSTGATRVSFLQLVDTAESPLNNPKTLFLQPTTPVSAYTDALEGDAEVVWKSAEIILRQGSRQKVIQKGTANTLVFIDGTATLQMEALPNYESWALIHATQDMILKFTQKPARFSAKTPSLFAIVGGNLHLQGTSSSVPSSQMSGYFFIQGEHCMRGNASLHSLYWLGSLACEHTPSASSTMLYLKHHPYPQPGPAGFNRMTLRFQGVRLLDT